jgi:hypothetical protein
METIPIITSLPMEWKIANEALLHLLKWSLEGRDMVFIIEHLKIPKCKITHIRQRANDKSQICIVIANIGNTIKSPIS